MSESKDNEKNNAGEESRDASSAEEEVSSSAASEKKSAAPQNTEITEQQKQADQESRKDQAESKPDDVKAESPQPAKPAKKKGSHRKIWQIAGICVLCFGCGFLGGVTANYLGPGHAQKETASSDRDDLEKIFGQLPEQNNGMMALTRPRHRVPRARMTIRMILTIRLRLRLLLALRCSRYRLRMIRKAVFALYRFPMNPMRQMPASRLVTALSKRTIRRSLVSAHWQNISPARMLVIR